MPRQTMLVPALTVLVAVLLPAGATAADTASPAPSTAAKTAAPAQPATSTVPATTTTPQQVKLAAPTVPSKPAPKPAPRKPKGASNTEFEVSAYTSEVADQMNGRINIGYNDPSNRVWLITGYYFIKSRSFTKTKVYEAEFGTLDIDLGYRQGGPKGYRFISAVSSVRARKPEIVGYPNKAGYTMLSAGIGSNLFPALDCEAALADVSWVTNTGDTERRLMPVYTFGLKAPITKTALLDGSVRVVEPFADDPLVDFRLNMTYRLTAAMSLRLTYLANNLLNNLLIPMSSMPNTSWDKSFRISLVFSRYSR